MSNLSNEEKKGGIFHRIGRNLVKGATAEIDENPPKILDVDRILDIAEIVIGIGLFTAALVLLKKKPPQTLIHIDHMTIIK